MIREQIKKDLEEAVKPTIDNLHLTINKAEVEVSRTGDAKFGDYSSNIALRLSTIDHRSVIPAKAGIKPKKILDQVENDKVKKSEKERKSNQSPMEVAKILADSLKGLPYVEKLEVKEPGFLNFFIKDDFWQEQVKEILDAGEKYGSNKSGAGKKARVEFVSANPTGPLHFGNARGGPIGDVLANVLAFSGWEVLREYLDNDRGNQVLELGKTLAAKAGLIEAKEEDLTYKGEYTKELAEQVREDLDISNLSEGEIIRKAGEIGVRISFSEIIHDCAEMGIKFDLIVHESDLQKKAPEILARLERDGLLKRKDKAVFFAPKSQFLEDREAVVVKNDGDYTYFTADVVYHSEKFESGFDLVIDVLGSNTFGHVPKLKALAETFGFDLSKFAVILYQFVRLKSGNEIVKMSKRAGNFVTAREVLEEVGPDALRFFILMYDPNSHIDFDLDLAREKSSKNPVYYVQYANARINSILAKFQISNFKFQISKANYELLTADYELNLIKDMTRLPELVEDISGNFAVHRLTAYAAELADAFHKFYENCPVISDDENLTAARLGLISAAKIVFENTFALLGISAPEKM